MRKVLLLMCLAVCVWAKSYKVAIESPGSLKKNDIIRIGQICPGDQSIQLIDFFRVTSVKHKELTVVAATQSERIKWSADPLHQDIVTSQFCQGPTKPVTDPPEVSKY